MRELISIVEARPKKAIAPPVDPAAQAQSVYQRALTVAATMSHALMIRQWNQEWVQALRQSMTKARQAHEKNQADEIEYYGNEHQPKPFALDVVEVTQPWWDQVVMPQIDEMGWAAKSEYERYQDWKPNVEQSDQMSLHQDEVRLARTIKQNGNDSPSGMLAVLEALENYAQSTQYYQDIDHTHLATRETEDFVAKIIPSILTICRLYGAKPAAQP